MTDPNAIFSRKLVVVTGKGGVGKSTLTAVLAMAGARRGLRTCIVELYGGDEICRRIAGTRGTFLPQQLEPNLDHRTFTPDDCVDDFGRRKLKVNALVRLVFRSRIMRAFMEAVPGLHDLVQLGKLENMISEPKAGDPVYDFVVLDAPATGHGMTMLASARTMRDMTRVGPFADLAEVIEVFFEDKDKTGVVPVTLPEELPVNETLELLASLDGEGPLVVVVNQVRDSPLPADPAWDSVREGVPTPLRDVGDRAMDRWRSEQAVIERLRASTELPVVELPRGDVEALVEAWPQ